MAGMDVALDALEAELQRVDGLRDEILAARGKDAGDPAASFLTGRISMSSGLRRGRAWMLLDGTMPENAA